MAKNTSVSRENTRRAQQLLRNEIQFIGNQTFPDLVLDEIRTPRIGNEDKKTSAEFKSLPIHLARLCERQLLTAEQERALFREMNYLKYLAHATLSEIVEEDADEHALDRAEQLLAEAELVRNRIAKANMRLVISIVKKFVTPQISFDEMLSDGIDVLFNAVDKFDYDRGFRFSTYAYRSIARNAYRSVVNKHKENSRFSELDESAAEERGTASMEENTWEALRGFLAKMLPKLDHRERFIVRTRYALGQERNMWTFQKIADRLGVSKERVRQLEKRAVKKLEQMAASLPTDDLESHSIFS